MFSAVQILLMIVVVLLTGLSLVLGLQAFRLIKQLRQTARDFQLFLKKEKSDEFLAHLSSSINQDQSEKESPSREADSLVSVGFRSNLRSNSSPVSSRSFYRNGRNLS
ncbi:MAG: hypothetical protein PHR64_02470 [Candidatus Shapirobacteria bacterium]|nr:hypothetical protein [Candidatus Shapirobacteria bacterium]MDD5073691.1 hypothetical protein [Candidatus Shapirobacteria bacterium]MDD5481788.1 hypothetical protein [Candidatus Shapirobacteria bacterium]